MLFHIRLFLSFMLSLVVSVNCFDVLEEEEDAGADNALRQALVLVEMLRSEYIKVLRENKDLAAAIKMVTTSSSPSESLKSIENNTHGASTLAVNLVSTISGSGDGSGGVVKVSASPIPSADIPTSSSSPNKSISNFARHYKNLFGSGLSRRFMKQPSGKVRNKMKFRRNMPENGATIGLKTKHETKSSTKKALLTTKSKTIRTSFKSKGHLRDLQHAKKTTKHNLKDKAETQDPLVAQIASEILNELKRSDLKNVHYLRKQIHDVIEKVTRPDPEKAKHKTSLKIHLGLSSRMPLPLPENNAFCFYVPKSPLCGSMKRKRK